jgi:glutathione S-transferase
MPSPNPPPVILFGYQSSPFTNKVRLVLRLKQIPYQYVQVPSMMPRPFLKNTFNLTYRKIPVVAIGHDIYCDTAVILEALEQFFPEGSSLYPKGKDGRTNRALIRGFASYWTDRPFFRVTTGLIPGAVWKTSFGEDRASLIGHNLDAEKLAKKTPRNLSALDLHLSILEPQVADTSKDGGWIFATERPSAADVALWYQLAWGRDIAAGRGIYNLTGGRTEDKSTDVTDIVFNPTRYPNLWRWYHAFETFVEDLPVVERDCSEREAEEVLKGYQGDKMAILQTAATPLWELDRRNELITGVKVSVAPDDTGRDK